MGDERIDWVRIESFGLRNPAEMLATHLLGNGIDARVHGDDAGGLGYHIGPSGIEVLVPADRVEDAHALMADVALTSVADAEDAAS